MSSFSKSVSDGPAVKAHNDLAGIGVDPVDVADITVVDLLVHNLGSAFTQ